MGRQEIGQKVEKLGKIALGAAEQSKRESCPKHYPFEKRQIFLTQLEQFDRIVVAYEESAKEGEAAALIQSLTGLGSWKQDCSLSLVQREVLPCRN